MAHYKAKESDLREILSILASAAETLGSQSENYDSRLKGFTQQVQLVSRGQDLGDIRRALTKQVYDLRVAAETMWKENQSSVAHLQNQLNHFQQRLERAEALASSDELTGLLNRREGEARLAAKVEAKLPFCLMVLDLDRFKAINDQNGHSAGDQVLRIFARRLSKLVRPTDVVCRWGGDEFLVLMDCPMSAVLKRSPQFRSELNGRYPVVLIGREFHLQVSASMGVAEYCEGDDAEHLFARADEDLYRQKKLPSQIA